MTLQWAFRSNLYNFEQLYEKSYEKKMKIYLKSYVHCFKYWLVTIWHVSIVFGVWFWGVLVICSFCTVGASCKAIAAAG